MPIIFRWIFNGCVFRALATLAVMLGIYLIMESFDKARHLGKGLNVGLMVEYMILKMPFMISEFMPIIMLLACSMFVSDLSRHRELVALRAAGLGLNKLALPLIAVGILAAAASFSISEWVTPTTNQRIDHIEQVNIHHRKDPSQGLQWLRDGQRLFRLQPLGEDVFQVVIIETDVNGGWLRRIEAARGSYIDGQWILIDVHISAPTNKDIMLKHMPSLHVPTPASPETAAPPSPRHMNLFALWNYTRELSDAGLSAASYELALHRKLAAPIGCLIMVILATSLCMRLDSRITGRAGGLALALGLGVLFYVISNASGLLAGGERLPAVFAAWWPDLVFGGLAGYLLLHHEGH